MVEPNDEVVKGSAVTLVVGLGKGSRMTNLPDLIGVNIEDVKNRINMASLNIGKEIYLDDDEAEDLYVLRMEPEYSLETMVPLGSTVDVWYRSIKSFDFDWYKYEKFRRDSIVEVWRVKKYSADTIKYVIDSFNYILKNRTFSYDPEQRALDMQMVYPRPEAELPIIIFEDVEDVDYEIDTIYFYDE